MHHAIFIGQEILNTVYLLKIKVYFKLPELRFLSGSVKALLHSRMYQPFSWSDAIDVLQCRCLLLKTSRWWFATARLQRCTGILSLCLRSRGNCRDTRFSSTEIPTCMMESSLSSPTVCISCLGVLPPRAWPSRNRTGEGAAGTGTGPDIQWEPERGTAAGPPALQQLQRLRQGL